MTEHGPKHEELLERVVTQDLDPGSVEVSRLVESCKECKEVLSNLRRVGDLLNEDARIERESLAADASELEARVPDMFMAIAMADSSAASSGTAHTIVGARPSIPRWLLVAASLLVVFGLWRWLDAKSPSRAELEPGTHLGAGAELLEPVGGAADFGVFTWKFDPTPGGWCELRIWDASNAATTNTNLILGPLEIEGSRWEPEMDLPDSIRWGVTIYDPSGSVVGSASTSAQR